MEAVSERAAAPGVAQFVCEILKQRPLAVNFLNSSLVVRNFLDVAVKTADATVAVCAFETLDKIFAKFPPDRAVLDEFFDLYLPQLERVDCVTGFAVKVFRRAPMHILERILDTPVNTFLAQGVLAAFRAMDADERGRVAASLDLPRRIMAALPGTVANGHLTDLARIIVSEAPGWRRLQEDVVAKRIASRESYIGGKEGPRTEVQWSVETDKDDEVHLVVPVMPGFVPEPPPEDDEEESGSEGEELRVQEWIFFPEVPQEDSPDTGEEKHNAEKHL
jgi:hypothetical protein